MAAGKTCGYGKSGRDDTMGDPQPSSYKNRLVVGGYFFVVSQQRIKKQTTNLYGEGSTTKWRWAALLMYFNFTKERSKIESGPPERVPFVAARTRLFSCAAAKKRSCCVCRVCIKLRSPHGRGTNRTSGKGLALRIGFVGLSLEVGGLFVAV